MLQDRWTEICLVFRDLEDTHFVYEPSLARLLNVAELSRKYRFSSYEAWAVDRLHAACQGTTLPFSLSTALASSSSITLTEHVHSISTDIDSLCARLLNVAYASRHSPLLLLMMKKLVVQILWHDYHPGAILFDAVEALSRRRSRYQRHIRQLLGVIYYRMLVDMQYATASDKSPILVFPPAHGCRTAHAVPFRSQVTHRDVGQPEILPVGGAYFAWDVSSDMGPSLEGGYAPRRAQFQWEGWPY